MACFRLGFINSNNSLARVISLNLKDESVGHWRSKPAHFADLTLAHIHMSGAYPKVGSQ